MLCDRYPNILYAMRCDAMLIMASAREPVVQYPPLFARFAINLLACKSVGLLNSL